MSTLPDESRPSLAPGVRLQQDAVSGKPVLLFPEGILFLNPTAHDIVTRCDGTVTLGMILTALAEVYEVAPDDLRHDVQTYLGDLQQRKLLVCAS